MAVMVTSEPLRHALQLARITAAIASVWSVLLLSAAAQPASSPSVRPLDAAGFVRVAHSSAVLQAKAAEIVASRQARPEAQAFARKMADFRREQLPKLEALAREHRLAVPTVQEFEHQVILENLEPLDFLALSRRYAELQTQALEQEVHGYTAAESSADEWLRTFAAEMRPRLEPLLAEAQALNRIVGP